MTSKERIAELESQVVELTAKASALRSWRSTAKTLEFERDELRTVYKLYLKEICDLFGMGVSEAPLSDIKIRLAGLEREAKGRIHAEIVADELRTSVERLQIELTGAIKAQDERERQAGIRCEVPYELSGCDWPDAVAEKVAELRETVERLQKEIHSLRAGSSK
jgi:hypothetical protein